MQKKLNLSIKNREGFRPFAPMVLEEDAGEYFDLDVPSPYMLLVKQLKKSRQIPYPAGSSEWDWAEKLYYRRSDLPAITHIDYSARIQTVDEGTNPRLWQLLRAFRDLTGYGVLINTSFNVRDEPIVNSPEDAFRCFWQTKMDYLVIDNLVFYKNQYIAQESIS
jgi:carbamoyltransferase